MRCPKCGKAHTRVVDSRMQESNNTIKRRRECCSCNYRFTTFERCEDPIEVIKSDGSKQRFDRNKLLVGLMRATIKRDIDTKKLNEIIDDIEVELRSRRRIGAFRRKADYTNETGRLINWTRLGSICWIYNICCTFHSFDFWTWKLVNFRI